MSFDLPASLLAALDAVRAIPATLNLRSYSINAIKRVWSGERPGIGTSTTTSTALTVNGQNPRFVRLSSREVIASAGKYEDGDWRLTLTPEYSTGGYAVSDFSSDSTNQELFFQSFGNGFEASGAYFVKIDQEVGSNLTYKIVLRRTAQSP